MINATAHVPRQQDFYRAARIFKGLAHPARVELACSLTNNRIATQKELLDELHWPQSTMARHLGSMKDRGLIRGTRVGNQVLLQLEDTITPELLAAVCEWIHPETGERFGRPLTGAIEDEQ